MEAQARATALILKSISNRVDFFDVIVSSQLMIFYKQMGIQTRL